MTSRFVTATLVTCLLGRFETGCADGAMRQVTKGGGRLVAKGATGEVSEKLNSLVGTAKPRDKKDDDQLKARAQAVLKGKPTPGGIPASLPPPAMRSVWVSGQNSPENPLYPRHLPASLDNPCFERAYSGESRRGTALEPLQPIAPEVLAAANLPEARDAASRVLGGGSTPGNLPSAQAQRLPALAAARLAADARERTQLAGEALEKMFPPESPVADGATQPPPAPGAEAQKSTRKRSGQPANPSTRLVANVPGNLNLSSEDLRNMWHNPEPHLTNRHCNPELERRIANGRRARRDLPPYAEMILLEDYLYSPGRETRYQLRCYVSIRDSMYIIRGLTGVEKSARYAPVDDLCVLQFRESYAVGQAEYLKRIKAGEPGEKARGAILLSQITNFVTDASQTDVRRLAESPYLPPYLCRQFQDILDDSEEPNASISSGQGNLTLRPNDPGFEGILRQRFPVDGVPDAYVRLMSYRGNVFTIAAAAGQSHGNESAILTLDQAIDRSVRLVGMGHVTPHGTAVLDAEIVGPFYAVRQISRARSFTDSSLELVPGGAPPPKSQDELQRRRTQEMQLTQGGLVKLRFHANWHSMLRLGFIRSGKGVQPETRLIVETARKRILYAAAGGKATYERFARQCRKSGIAG